MIGAGFYFWWDNVALDAEIDQKSTPPKLCSPAMRYTIREDAAHGRLLWTGSVRVAPFHLYVELISPKLESLGFSRPDGRMRGQCCTSFDGGSLPMGPVF